MLPAACHYARTSAMLSVVTFICCCMLAPGGCNSHMMLLVRKIVIVSLEFMLQYSCSYQVFHSCVVWGKSYSNWCCSTNKGTFKQEVDHARARGDCNLIRLNQP